jgi:hypothetical protein
MALQRVEGPDLDSAYEGASAFLGDLPSCQGALQGLELLEGQRVSLVEQATRNLQVQARQIGGIQAEFGEPPASEIINGD